MGTLSINVQLRCFFFLIGNVPTNLPLSLPRKALLRQWSFLVTVMKKNPGFFFIYFQLHFCLHFFLHFCLPFFLLHFFALLFCGRIFFAFSDCIFVFLHFFKFLIS